MKELHEKLSRNIVCISLVGKIDDKRVKNKIEHESETALKSYLSIYKPASRKDRVKRLVLAHNKIALNYPMSKNKEDIYWKKGISRVREFIAQRAYYKDESFYYVDVNDISEIKQVFENTKKAMYDYYGIEVTSPFEFKLIIRPYYQLGQYEGLDLDEELIKLSFKIITTRQNKIIELAQKCIDSVNGLIDKVTKQDIFAIKSEGKRPLVIRGRGLDSLKKFILETERFNKEFPSDDVQTVLDKMIEVDSRVKEEQERMRLKLKEYNELKKKQFKKESK